MTLKLPIERVFTRAPAPKEFSLLTWSHLGPVPILHGSEPNYTLAVPALLVELTTHWLSAIAIDIPFEIKPLDCEPFYHGYGHEMQ